MGTIKKLLMRKFHGSWKSNFTKSLFLIPVILLVSCRAIPFSTATNETDFPKYLYKNLNSFPSQYISCDQINIKYDDGSVKSANLSLNIKRGDFIYANINYFGIEIGRVLLTPDSLKIINRLEKTYFFGSIKSLNAKFGLEVSYENIESLLLKGAAIDENLTQKIVRANITENDSLYIFKSKNGADFSLISKYRKDNFYLNSLELNSGNSNKGLFVTLEINKYSKTVPEKLFVTIQKEDFKASISADIGTINYAKFEAKSFTVNSRYSEMDF